MFETRNPTDPIQGRANPIQRRRWLAGLAAAALAPWARAQGATGAQRKPEAPMFRFRGTDFVHRWSKNGQHEFTPFGEADLAAWRQMVTLNVHNDVRSGEQLAAVANQVLGNYQRHGKILQTRSTPRTPTRPAEHLIVAVLGNPEFLEAVFARSMLMDGTGLVAVVSHRVYGKAAGSSMSEWLASQGALVEQALMAWDSTPRLASLQRLPVSA